MDVSGEHAGRWWKAFWWSRGIIAAMTLTTLVPNFTDLSRVDFLRAFQLILLEWDRLTSFLGQIVGHLPFVPDLPSWLVNAILFSISICIPAAYGFFVRSPISNVDMHAVASIPQRILDRPFSYGKLKETLRPAYTLFAESFYWVLAIVLVPLLAFSPYRIVYAEDTFLPVWVYKAFIAFFVLATIFVVLIGIFSIPRFAKALLVTLSFLATLELLYLANTPNLSDWIDRNYCDKLDPGAKDCAALDLSQIGDLPVMIWPVEKHAV